MAVLTGGRLAPLIRQVGSPSQMGTPAELPRRLSCEISVSLRATTTARGGSNVVTGHNTQIADLVAQGVAVDSHVLGRTGQIALVGAQHGDDVLLLEFALGLVESHASTDQFIDKLKESTV